ncbi:hypothetical protein GCM10007877_04900 [Marinibactrum halimedae]|uniref:Uncharacterized protein n=1 Tax=Marinibactrum halimedae TaxID=1444977 RepID=A0AA37T6X0_9GAMM|nr:hypothetical protein GCM10007877_04900 [Marinibactrum halimedae]
MSAMRFNPGSMDNSTFPLNKLIAITQDKKVQKKTFYNDIQKVMVIRIKRCESSYRLS